MGAFISLLTSNFNFKRDDPKPKLSFPAMRFYIIMLHPLIHIVSK